MKRINTNPHIQTYTFERNKFFPNNKMPLLIYRDAFLLPDQKNKAADIVQRVLLSNNWGNTWRNGIYDFHHYHSNAHECLAVCSGMARVIFGGPGQKSITLKKGDAIILPGGLGHRCTFSTKDFLCVGAYPNNKDYDIFHGKEEEFVKATARIGKLSIPSKDPIFGKHGFLKSYWTKIS